MRAFCIVICLLVLMGGKCLTEPEKDTPPNVHCLPDTSDIREFEPEIGSPPDFPEVPAAGDSSVYAH
ncbi:hypothetical protein ES705_23653 [subsurface metagenome]